MMVWFLSGVLIGGSTAGPQGWKEAGAMNKILHGVVRGQMIELREPVGVADGQEVEVVVKFSLPSRPWGEGIRSSAGALADQWTAEDDRILQEIQQARNRDTRPEIPL
jgi:hypothetical protein